MRIVRPKNGNKIFRGETNEYEVVQSTYSFPKERLTKPMPEEEQGLTISDYILGQEPETNTWMIQESDLESAVTNVHDELKQKGELHLLGRGNSEENITTAIYEQKGKMFVTINQFYVDGLPVTINESLVKKSYK